MSITSIVEELREPAKLAAAATGPSADARAYGGRGQHVLPIETIAAGNAGPALDGWIRSAEIAIDFLTALSEVDRRACGAELLELARWCRRRGSSPLELTTSELSDYLTVIEQPDQPEGRTFQAGAGVAGYFRYAQHHLFGTSRASDRR